MATDYRAHLTQRLIECWVPTELHDGLIEYFAARRPTGSFLRACLENNLSDAASRADFNNRFYLREIVSFLIFYCPANAWGSADAVDRWLQDPSPAPEIFD